MEVGGKEEVLFNKYIANWKSSRDVLYNKVHIVNNTVLYT